MENLALNCTVTQLLNVIEESQVPSGTNIITEAQQLDKIIESDYNKYSELDKLKFLIKDNKLIDITIFNEIVAKEDRHKLKLAEFYNKTFANTILDVLPDQFYFKSKLNANLNTYYTTSPVLISGLASNKLILITCENGEIDAGPATTSTNNLTTSSSGIFTSSKIVKTNNDGNIIITAKGKSSTNYGISQFIVVAINRIYGTFQITTKLDPSGILIL